MEISFVVDIERPIQEVEEKVRLALKDEGFGVLTYIDVKATLKEKLGEDFQPYIILGACNPPLAHRALSADTGVGVMLPCNVTLESTAEGTRVSLTNPEAMLTFGELDQNPALREVATEARERLKRVSTRLTQEYA